MTIGLTDDIGPLGSFPILNDIYLKGGLQTVLNTTERDNIDPASRKAGMLVWDQTGLVMYQLGPGLGNGDWTVFSSGGGSGSGNDFVFDVAGVQAGNVYTDFDDLMTAVATKDGVVRIISLTNATVSSGGPYDISNVELYGTTNIVTLNFDGSVSFTGTFPRKLTDIIINNQTSAPLWTAQGSSTVLFGGSSIGAINAGMINTTGSNFAAYFHDASTASTSPASSFGVFDGNGDITIVWNSSIDPGLNLAFGTPTVNYYPMGPTFNALDLDNTTFGNVSTDILVYREQPFVLVVTESTNLDNYQPSKFDRSDIVHINSTQDIDISGFGHTTGGSFQQVKKITNVNNFNIRILHNSTSSSVGNRVICPDEFPIMLAPNESALIYFYDESATSPWRAFKLGGSGLGDFSINLSVNGVGSTPTVVHTFTDNSPRENVSHPTWDRGTICYEILATLIAPFGNNYAAIKVVAVFERRDTGVDALIVERDIAYLNGPARSDPNYDISFTTSQNNINLLLTGVSNAGNGTNWRVTGYITRVTGSFAEA